MVQLLASVRSKKLRRRKKKQIEKNLAFERKIKSKEKRPRRQIWSPLPKTTTVRRVRAYMPRQHQCRSSKCLEQWNPISKSWLHRARGNELISLQLFRVRDVIIICDVFPLFKLDWSNYFVLLGLRNIAFVFAVEFEMLSWPCFKWVVFLLDGGHWVWQRWLSMRDSPFSLPSVVACRDDGSTDCDGPICCWKASGILRWCHGTEDQVRIVVVVAKCWKQLR